MQSHSMHCIRSYMIYPSLNIIVLPPHLVQKALKDAVNRKQPIYSMGWLQKRPVLFLYSCKK